MTTVGFRSLRSAAPSCTHTAPLCPHMRTAARPRRDPGPCEPMTSACLRRRSRWCRFSRLARALMQPLRRLYMAALRSGPVSRT